MGCTQAYADSIFRLYDLMPVVLYLGSAEGDTVSYLQCCHGGMEPGYDPWVLLGDEQNSAFQWLGKIRQKSNVSALIDSDLLSEAQKKQLADLSYFYDYLPQSPCFPICNGFMWNDFQVESNLKLVDVVPGRGLAYGKDLTKAVLEVSSGNDYQIKGVMRAHQHYGKMMDELLKHNGLYKLWKSDLAQKSVNLYPGIVCTFMVAPDNSAGSLYGFNYDTFALLKTAKKFQDWTLEPITNQNLFPLRRQLKSKLPLKSPASSSI